MILGSEKILSHGISCSKHKVFKNTTVFHQRFYRDFLVEPFKICNGHNIENRSQKNTLGSG
jgi:hypothetical protein